MHYGLSAYTAQITGVLTHPDPPITGDGTGKVGWNSLFRGLKTGATDPLQAAETPPCVRRREYTKARNVGFMC